MNVYPSFVVSTALVVVFIAALFGVLAGIVSRDYLIILTGIYLILNIRFLNYLEQVRGLFAMITMTPFLVLDHAVCLIGSAMGILKGMSSESKKSKPASH